MSKVLILVGHPDLSRSRCNSALLDAVKDLDHVTVHDLYATYPDFAVDGDAERALLLEHDVIVFQHPVQWYNLTPLFRQWQDIVLTHDWAFNYEGRPSRTTGKKGVVAVTFGGDRTDYTPGGLVGRTAEELLNNWDSTLRLCQFDIQPVFTLHGAAFGVPDEDLVTASKEYRALLASFA
ncbi:NAD(P)H-dependent oxidoreductase [Streptomyces sp. NPDC002588]|uniref:NAD(P)H-dependent oxidoreductase n=1 Tax=Streptomyces sp. NPDC002588 TaxID=3154419 RepID=UPI003326C60D